MHLELIDISINMADHFTKALNCTLFHRHADFLLGHVLPNYCHVYQSIVGTYTTDNIAFEWFVPESFTTLTFAAVTTTRVHALLPEDYYADNPWLLVVYYGMVSTIHIACGLIDCEGVLA